jgi:hypothetical protein
MRPRARRSAPPLGHMTTLSSRHSGFMKRVFPFFALPFGFACSYWLHTRHRDPGPVWKWILVFVLATVVFVVVLRRKLWNLADSVELVQETLRIRRWRIAADIPLSDVKGVAIETSYGGRYVTLTLGRACALGKIVRFHAPSIGKAPDVDNELESLTQRVQSQEL